MLRRAQSADIPAGWKTCLILLFLLLLFLPKHKGFERLPDGRLHHLNQVGFVAILNHLSSALTFFPECVARVPVSLGGLGAGLCCQVLRLRSQPTATVCVRAVRLSTVANASGGVPKACQVDSLSPQLYWRLQGTCLCE